MVQYDCFAFFMTFAIAIGILLLFSFLARKKSGIRKEVRRIQREMHTRQVKENRGPPGPPPSAPPAPPPTRGSGVGVGVEKRCPRCSGILGLGEYCPKCGQGRFDPVPVNSDRVIEIAGLTWRMVK